MTETKSMGNPQIRVPEELKQLADEIKRSDQTRGQALLTHIIELRTMVNYQKEEAITP